jgi:hypothetical protein
LEFQKSSIPLHRQKNGNTNGSLNEEKRTGRETLYGDKRINSNFKKILKRFGGFKK